MAEQRSQLNGHEELFGDLVRAAHSLLTTDPLRKTLEMAAGHLYVQDSQLEDADAKIAALESKLGRIHGWRQHWFETPAAGELCVPFASLDLILDGGEADQADYGIAAALIAGTPETAARAFAAVHPETRSTHMTDQTPTQIVDPFKDDLHDRETDVSALSAVIDSVKTELAAHIAALDDARASGAVLTYGHIQERLRTTIALLDAPSEELRKVRDAAWCEGGLAAQERIYRDHPTEPFPDSPYEAKKEEPSNV